MFDNKALNIAQPSKSYGVSDGATIAVVGNGMYAAGRQVKPSALQSTRDAQPARSTPMSRAALEAAEMKATEDALAKIAARKAAKKEAARSGAPSENYSGSSMSRSAPRSSCSSCSPDPKPWNRFDKSASPAASNRNSGRADHEGLERRATSYRSQTPISRSPRNNSQSAAGNSQSAAGNSQSVAGRSQTPLSRSPRNNSQSVAGRSQTPLSRSPRSSAPSSANSPLSRGLRSELHTEGYRSGDRLSVPQSPPPATTSPSSQYVRPVDRRVVSCVSGGSLEERQQMEAAVASGAARTVSIVRHGERVNMSTAGGKTWMHSEEYSFDPLELPARTLHCEDLDWNVPLSLRGAADAQNVPLALSRSVVDAVADLGLAVHSLVST